MADYANFTNMRALITGLARAMNLVNPEMERHHEQTAYLSLFLTYFTGEIAPVSLDDTLELTKFMSRIIDYRSPFTATHSAGVAASAWELAKLAGLGEDCAKQVDAARDEASHLAGKRYFDTLGQVA